MKDEQRRFSTTDADDLITSYLVIINHSRCLDRSRSRSIPPCGPCRRSPFAHLSMQARYEIARVIKRFILALSVSREETLRLQGDAQPKRIYVYTSPRYRRIRRCYLLMPNPLSSMICKKARLSGWAWEMDTIDGLTTEYEGKALLWSRAFQDSSRDVWFYMGVTLVAQGPFLPCPI